MKADELREKYLSFFETKGCVRRPSDVLVPRWDPSVLFTPAGMNQFKDHFLGRCKLEFTRATTCQKCLRTGDIDNVGRTAYHHTFFEMLGNFSFGDYFKREAILWAWEFLTDKKWLGLDPERLSATVYLDDDEAASIWTDEVGLPAAKVRRIGEDENFWPANAPSQGPDGVCGPCSEIYYHSPWGPVEIWNLVFTQFNRVGPPPNNLRPLPKKNIDTGMGLERTAAVLQGVESNFHIDILRPLVEAAAEVCKVRYDPQSDDGRRLRRIADHVRACTFAIHENVYPDNEKQGYVVRKLIRRAALDGYRMNVHKPFLCDLPGVVAELMAEPYPELRETVGRVAQALRNEESQFFDIINAGMPRAEKLLDQTAGRRSKTVPGREAFDLLQTYGFPPELTETLALERGLQFDWDGFRKAQKRHEEASGAGRRVALFKEGPLHELKKTMHGSEFVGYDAETTEGAVVVGLIVADQLAYQLDEIDGKQPAVVVLDKTPFYGEMGGQVGDTGELVAPGVRFEVVDTQVEDGFILHVGFLREGKLSYKDQVCARVNALRRQAIRRAHSATHLLHYALRKHLGQQTQQKGSKVEPDQLRFDFNYDEALGPERLELIEREVNALVVEGSAVQWALMPKEDAQKLGAMMLFGEKYPDVVRVVSVGNYSRELCGGTHLTNSSQVGLFKIVGEESVAKGIRRITALTGMAAWEHVCRIEKALHETALVLRTSPDEVPQRVAALAHEVRQLKKQAAAGAKADGVTPEKLLAQAADMAGVKVVVAQVPGFAPQGMRDLIDQLRRKAAPVAALLASQGDEGRVTLIAGLSRDLAERGLDAVQWIRAAAAEMGGGGGGRPDMAQAGGKEPDKLPQALDAARAKIKELLGIK
ncbi:MAG: alanine--tRNA ligase [Thermoguttaceae bacterium]|jgi:alanyl-tRNA synthetase|nr:alanine--tRNA ligase [Thermoguttaceae bacterium]